MSNKMKHLSIFAVAIAMAGLLLAGGASADKPEELAGRCSDLVSVGKKAVIFILDKDGNFRSLKNKGSFRDRSSWPPKNEQKAVHSIQVVVGNPVVCYVANGELICIKY